MGYGSVTSEKYGYGTPTSYNIPIYQAISDEVLRGVLFPQARSRRLPRPGSFAPWLLAKPAELTWVPLPHFRGGYVVVVMVWC